MKSILLLSIFIPTLAYSAGYNGSARFSDQERSYHKSQISKFVEVAGNCLNEYQAEHLVFFHSNCRNSSKGKICLSKYYGERRYSKKRGQKRADGTPLTYLGDALKEAGFSTDYMDQMQANSCVGMALSCLKQAFLETDQRSQWDKVLAFTKANGVGGTALQDALRNLGWSIYYWNPSPKDQIVQNNAKWDREEANWKSKGHHAYRYNQVITNGTYWYNKVDNKTDLVGFRSSEPEILKRIPFWVGTAHTGYHVFPGTFSDVVEAHSTRDITTEDNLEFSRFSPFAPGGGPRWTPTEKYRSGLIAIPPL